MGTLIRTYSTVLFLSSHWSFMETIKDAYGDIAAELIANSIQPSEINPTTVFQQANKTSRNILNQKIISKLMHPNSDILNLHRLKEIYRLSQNGHSCLITMEHYSNFDLPNLIYLLETKKNCVDIANSIIANSIIAIAGMKLNAESDFVRAFTEAYTRIVIYPSRSLTPLIGRNTFAEEQGRSRKINRAGLHEMVRQKRSGKLILIFPTGTRFRKDQPETQRGLMEVDSYIRGFDYFLPIAIAGNILRINASGSGMDEDYVHEDHIVFQIGKIVEAKKWHHDARSLASEDQNPKQYVADRIMDILKDLHQQAEKHRQFLITRDRP